jgi:hypothetical protein
MGPCHYVMTRPSVANGEGLQIRKEVTNILNKHSWTDDKGLFSSFAFGEMLTTPLRTNLVPYEMLHRASEVVGFFGTTWHNG